MLTAIPVPGFYAFHITFHTANILVPSNVVLLLLLAYGSIDPFQKAGWRVNCYWSGILGWAYAMMTFQPWVYFYSSGYVASLCQGVAHEWCHEAANLPELAKRTGPEKAGDEHAHTAFFPCLILHSAYESLVHRSGSSVAAETEASKEDGPQGDKEL
eukprot:gnl/TRDRNA2_/TRDRNA2_166573_c0_seq2.p1 gnl/TRDRNA2_/TRDRNA2_166573_c0~~gnl/TRDRNA2_/TRDRNA2_166573_c0_seq2.p1  ORF type:complete len:157 (-),score=16.93 gnl/TRDRNA2_/TRDRNA2_166573_c0_seq2:54-524(-)